MQINRLTIYCYDGDICNGQQAFLYRGAGVWKRLDSEVKQASSLKAFNDTLKLFKIVYFVIYL